jgi:hypothetical protein
MALTTRKFAPKLLGATGVAAALSLLAVPAAAVDLPKPAAVKAYDGESGNVNRDRRWRRDRGIDAGDVIAGVLVLGAIAAVADAAKDRRDRDYRYPERSPYPDDAGYRGVDQRGYQSGGIDRAVEICVDAVERGGDRVGSVDSANRDGNGWYVAGALEQGAGYSCRIDNDGRVSDVRVDGDEGGYGYGDDYGSGPAEDYEYDDDYYAEAREQQGYADPNAREDGYDGRYETAEAPDFEQ